MYSTQQTNVTNLETKSLSNFRIFVLIFIVLNAIAIALYLFLPLVSALSYVLATIALGIGIYLFSKKNGHAGAGLKVLVLVSIAVLFQLLVAVLDSIYPYSIQINPTLASMLNQIAVTNNGFGLNVYPIAFCVLFSGTFMILGALSFTGWFSETFNKKFNLYSYFGWFFLVGQIIIFVGYNVLVAALNEVLAGNHGLSTTGIAFPEGIILFGMVVLLSSLVIEIVAGIKILGVVNNKINPSE